MARPLRIEYPGAVYHVTSRGNERKRIYRDSRDRLTFLNTLQHVNDRYHWICHAYCLMNNHYHLLIETPEGNLSIGMRQLNGVYTQLFNVTHERAGHLLQGRYKAILIQKDSHLLEVCRYVVLNPVRAGMVEKPEGWKWSSYLATAGRRRPHACLTTDWVLAQFGAERGKAEREYRQFVQSGIGQEPIWREVRGQVLLGEEDFLETMTEYIGTRREIAEIPRSQRFANRPTLEELLSEETVRKKGERDRAIVRAVEHYGYRQREVADHLGMYFTSISRIVNARSRKGRNGMTRK